MKNVIGILREGRSKRGEKRVAITPESVELFVKQGFKFIVQSAIHPESKEIKRIFSDKQYEKAGAVIKEDLSDADIIFGLKEIFPSRILPDKTYLFFSHTHKGQIKNRSMLKKLVESKATVIDYELITNEKNERIVTAFTFNAGYAGMVDSLWTLGKRLENEGIKNPFSLIPQAVQGQDLAKVKSIMSKVAYNISKHGTPEDIPPIITLFLGRGKTAFGAREIFDILPYKEISVNELSEVFNRGPRNCVYSLQLGTEAIYRLKDKAEISAEHFEKLKIRGKRNFYLEHPDYFESKLDKILPYITVLMNCILWSPKYPRSVTKKTLRDVWKVSPTLKVIGDITCDPNGSIEFSKETWIDNPVYIYDPISEKMNDGFKGKGVAVMAVTNLPCEFSADASREFNNDLAPFLKPILSANYYHNLNDSHLPEEIKKAVIMWEGKFTSRYSYMKKYL